MAERCFLNNILDCYDEAEAPASSDEELSAAQECRTPAGSAPVKAFTSGEDLCRAGLGILDQAVNSLWTCTNYRVRDPFVYTGTAGPAYALLRAFLSRRDPAHLRLCLQMLETCASVAVSSHEYVTFLSGQPGVYSLGAVAAHYAGEGQLRDRYLELFGEVAASPSLASGPDQGGLGLPYELLYGRAGFLWAALFINHHLGDKTVPPAVTAPVVQAVLDGGVAGAGPGGGSPEDGCPLMFQWHNSRYWGAAHGLAGIMHVLLHFPLRRSEKRLVFDVLRYMTNHRFPSGNYLSSEGSMQDRLVHWCHGAAGVALTLCKAAEEAEDQDRAAFLQAAVEAGEVVWERGLLRRLGLCHGVSGNTYVFLALYRATKDPKYLRRARAFASFLHDNWSSLVASGQMHGGDHPDSLFEGRVGAAVMFIDMASPDNARFPAYEL